MAYARRSCPNKAQSWMTRRKAISLSAHHRGICRLGIGRKSLLWCSSSRPTKTKKPRPVETISPCRSVGSFTIRSEASVSRGSDNGWGGVCVRALATKSSERRRAASTRCCHCSRVTAPSGNAWMSCSVSWAGVLGKAARGTDGQESCHEENCDPICHGSTPIDPCERSHPCRPNGKSSFRRLRLSDGPRRLAANQRGARFCSRSLFLHGLGEGLLAGCVELLDT